MDISKELLFYSDDEDPDPNASDSIPAALSAPIEPTPTSPTPAEPTTQSDPTLDDISLNTGYKIVFDNIDKNVKPRFMRSEHQTRSLHYVQSYAVKDRVNFSSFSSEVRTEVNVFDVIPDCNDLEMLKSNFKILVSRLIVKHMPFFSTDYKGIPQRHIPHKYSKEMSSKSEVVSFMHGL